MFPTPIKSFKLQKFTNKDTGQKELSIGFHEGENPLRSPLIGSILVSPQLLKGFMVLLTKFEKENPDFFKDTKPVEDLGKISSPDEFNK